MNYPTKNGGGGSGAGSAEAHLRGHRAFGKIFEVADGVILVLVISQRRARGAASRGFVQRGAGPLSQPVGQCRSKVGC